MTRLGILQILSQRRIQLGLLCFFALFVSAVFLVTNGEAVGDRLGNFKQILNPRPDPVVQDVSAGNSTLGVSD